MPEARRVIIIGSGPAGLTAAIYTARANLAPLVIEGEPSSTSDQPGGQLMLTTDVENYPGFPDGIMGPELMMQFREQAERFGAEIITAKVTKVDLSGVGRSGCGSTTSEHRGRVDHRRHRRAVADARARRRGAADRPRRVDVRDLRRLLLPRPADRRRRRRRLGDGGGDLPHQVRRARSRSSTAATSCGRRRSCRTGRSRTRRSSSCGTPSSTDLVGDDEARGRRRSTNVETGRAVDAAGRPGCSSPSATRPNTDLFTRQLDMDDNGYLITHAGSTARTSTGVFACGDVQDHIYRQAITAAGSGCMAAIDAERWLEARHA